MWCSISSERSTKLTSRPSTMSRSEYLRRPRPRGVSGGERRAARGAHGGARGTERAGHRARARARARGCGGGPPVGVVGEVVVRVRVRVRVSGPPVGVVGEVVGEDGAEGGLVLGDEPRPLLEHVAHARGEGARVGGVEVQLGRHARGDERGDAAVADIDEAHVGRARAGGELGRGQRPLVEHQEVDLCMRMPCTYAHERMHVRVYVHMHVRASGSRRASPSGRPCPQTGAATPGSKRR